MRQNTIPLKKIANAQDLIFKTFVADRACQIEKIRPTSEYKERKNFFEWRRADNLFLMSDSCGKIFRLLTN